MPTSGSDTLANSLLTSVLDGKTFPIPSVDLSGPNFAQPGTTGPLFAAITKLDNVALASGSVGGDGAFDSIMSGLDAHLKREYESGRITGSEYTKAYIALTEAALGNAVQYLLSREQTYWQAVTQQLAAQTQQIAMVNARVELETSKAKFQTIAYEALTAEANYALTKIKLASEDVAFGIAKYNLDFMLPEQRTLLLRQQANMQAQTDGQIYENTNLKPSQKELVDKQVLQTQSEVDNNAYQLANIMPAQKAQIEAETAGKTYENTNILPEQKTLIVKQQLVQQSEYDQKVYQTANLLPSQKTLVDRQGSQVQAEIDNKSYDTTQIKPAERQVLLRQEALIAEQLETQRAQTRDTHVDGSPITGVLGQQKNLYSQQVTSYQRDAEVKAAKLFTDAWITQKTIDEGLLAPTNFQNAALDVILGKVRVSNSLT